MVDRKTESHFQLLVAHRLRTVIMPHRRWGCALTPCTINLDWRGQQVGIGLRPMSLVMNQVVLSEEQENGVRVLRSMTISDVMQSPYMIWALQISRPQNVLLMQLSPLTPTVAIRIQL